MLWTAVALRKESVDRNQNVRNGQNIKRVALRKESVDRNDTVQIVIVVMDTSLSARRAWIEMRAMRELNGVPQSLSARRAWIEIQRGRNHHTRSMSLSARRAWIEIKKNPLRKKLLTRRSPQGERG